MSDELKVRNATEDDAAGLLALRGTLFHETEFLLSEPEEFKENVDDERLRISRLNAKPNSTCLVAEHEGHLVGMLNAFGGQVNRQRHATSLALGVLRSHWGQGIATRLLNEALSWSRLAGVVRVDLTVHTSNARALAVYKRVGFEIEGVRRRSLLVSGRYVDEYLMSIINEV